MNRNTLRALQGPVLAIALALVLGAVLIAVDGKNPLEAYSAILSGSLGGVDQFGRTLEKSTPLVLAGLVVAFAFKAGLFNIGGQGQLVLGAAFAAWIGYRFSLPGIVHIPLALIVGGLAASILGILVGALKAYRGTHEVITTIMFNFIASNLTTYLVAFPDGPWYELEGNASNISRTPPIQESAEIPRLFAGNSSGIPLGFLVAILAAVVIWWLLAKTTFGFEVGMVGANRHAAVYAGISVKKITVITMAISAFLAGLGGAIETQGVVGRFIPGDNSGLGFDGITIALLAKSNPIAVIPAALLIGALQAGATQMQSSAGVSPDILNLVQAFILFFVAAPMVVRWITRVRSLEEDSGPQLSSSWGAA